jgi:hypothetical protein
MRYHHSSDSVFDVRQTIADVVHENLIQHPVFQHTQQVLRYESVRKNECRIP